MVVYSFSSLFILFWLILRPNAMLNTTSGSASNLAGMSFWKYLITPSMSCLSSSYLPIMRKVSERRNITSIPSDRKQSIILQESEMGSDVVNSVRNQLLAYRLVWMAWDWKW